MKEQTERAVVELHIALSTQHLTSRRPRLNAKEVMERVCKRYGRTRSTVYEYIKRHRKTRKH